MHQIVGDINETSAARIESRILIVRQPIASGGGQLQFQFDLIRSWNVPIGRICFADSPIAWPYVFISHEVYPLISFFSLSRPYLYRIPSQVIPLGYATKTTTQILVAAISRRPRLQLSASNEF